MKARLLLVEDELDLGNVVKQYLEINGFEVVWEQNATNALMRIKNKELFDLVLLDVQLPDFNGFDLAKQILLYNKNQFFLFLTARKEKDDKIFGLGIGAEDYITKPFDIDELILRIKIILRRSDTFVESVAENKETNPSSFTTSDVNFNADLMQLTIGGKVVMLTQREVNLLDIFYQNKNKVLKREEILTALWGDNDYFMGRSLDVFISRLRKILSKSNTLSIENIYSVGFVFKIQDY